MQKKIVLRIGLLVAILAISALAFGIAYADDTNDYSQTAVKQQINYSSVNGQLQITPYVILSQTDDVAFVNGPSARQLYSISSNGLKMTPYTPTDII